MTKLFEKRDHGSAPEMLFSKNISLSTDTRATRRNSNVLVVGSKSTQPQANYVLPNLQQLGCSYVVVDPNGTLKKQTEHMFREQGYEIKVFDIVQPQNSHHYNPFAYIRKDYDIVSMVDSLTRNFGKTSEVSTTPILSEMRGILLEAVAFYLYKERSSEEQTLSGVYKLIECAGKEPGLEDVPTVLDGMFSELKEKAPDHIAVRTYEDFLDFEQEHPEDAKKVVINALRNMELFEEQLYANLTGADQLDFAGIGLKPTVLYIRPRLLAKDFSPISENHLLMPLLLAQLFETLYHTAVDSCAHAALPIHIRIFLNNFGAYGTIQDFAQKLSTMRKYNISCDILVDETADIEAAYPEEWEIIASNCDTVIHLADTNKVPEYISKQVTDGIQSMEQTVVNPFTDLKKKKGGTRKTPYRIQRPHLTLSGAAKDSIKKCTATIKKGAHPITTIEELNNLQPGDCTILIRGCVPLADKVLDAPSNYPQMPI